MVPNPNPVFLRLSDGRVLGVPEEGKAGTGTAMFGRRHGCMTVKPPVVPVKPKPPVTTTKPPATTVKPPAATRPETTAASTK